MLNIHQIINNKMKYNLFTKIIIFQYAKSIKYKIFKLYPETSSIIVKIPAITPIIDNIIDIEISIKFFQ